MEFSLFGIKTHSLFDLWVLPHLLTGIVIGFTLYLIDKKVKIKFENKRNILIVLFLAYLWEGIEYMAEIGLFGNLIMNWFYGIEFLPNRLIVDPIMLIIGFWIYTKYPKTALPSMFIGSVWLIIHILIFPNAVYLHQLIQ